MAKIKKSKKQARRSNLVELWARHEPEEDKIMKALGETTTPRDEALRRALRNGAG